MNFTKGISCDQFYGPLDLFLNLLASREIDPLGIEIAPLFSLSRRETSLAELDEETFFSTSQETPLWAQLVLLKSKCLLPLEENNEDLAQTLEEDPGLLIHHLSEYAKIEDLSGLLEERMEEACKSWNRPKQEFVAPSPADNSSLVSSEELYNAFSHFLTKAQKRLHAIEKDPWNMESWQSHLLALLQEGSLLLNNLFQKPEEKKKAIALLLALLELMKAGKVTFDPDNQLFKSSISFLNTP